VLFAAQSVDLGVREHAILGGGTIPDQPSRVRRDRPEILGTMGDSLEIEFDELDRPLAEDSTSTYARVPSRAFNSP
jgi:hypothetical protein